MTAIKFIIADDHKIFRQGLRFALSDDPAIECVAEAGNGVELMQELGKQAADVVLLDLKMPAMDGFEAIVAIKKKYPSIKVIILTMYDDEHFILHLLENGANSYLLKNAEPEEIKMAIHSVYEAEYYFNDMVSTTMLKKIANKNQSVPRFKPEIKLTEREVEVLTLICKECNTGEIAKTIFLSARTVEGIRASLLEKIGVRNTAGLVMYAVRKGIIN